MKAARISNFNLRVQVRLCLQNIASRIQLSLNPLSSVPAWAGLDFARIRF